MAPQTISVCFFGGVDSGKVSALPLRVSLSLSTKMMQSCLVGHILHSQGTVSHQTEEKLRLISEKLLVTTMLSLTLPPLQFLFRQVPKLSHWMASLAIDYQEQGRGGTRAYVAVAKL